MASRDDLLRALAATAGGGTRCREKNIIANFDGHRGSKPNTPSTRKRDPEVDEFRPNQEVLHSLKDLPVDQILEHLQDVGTTVLEANAKGVAPVVPAVPKPSTVEAKIASPKKMDAILKTTEATPVDSFLPTRNRLQGIIKSLEEDNKAELHKSVPAVAPDPPVNTLLSATTPQQPAPVVAVAPAAVARIPEDIFVAASPAQAASTNEIVNALLSGAVAPAPTVDDYDVLKQLLAGRAVAPPQPPNPEEIVKKILVGDGLTDSPEVKLLKFVIVRQQNELEELQGVLKKQRLDHFVELKEAHQKQREDQKRLHHMLRQLQHKPAEPTPQKLQQQQKPAEPTPQKLQQQQKPSEPAPQKSQQKQKPAEPAPHKSQQSKKKKRKQPEKKGKQSLPKKVQELIRQVLQKRADQMPQTNTTPQEPESLAEQLRRNSKISAGTRTDQPRRNSKIASSMPPKKRKNSEIAPTEQARRDSKTEGGIFTDQIERKHKVPRKFSFVAETKAAPGTAMDKKVAPKDRIQTEESDNVVDLTIEDGGQTDSEEASATGEVGEAGTKAV